MFPEKVLAAERTSSPQEMIFEMGHNDEVSAEFAGARGWHRENAMGGL